MNSSAPPARRTPAFAARRVCRTFALLATLALALPALAPAQTTSMKWRRLVLDAKSNFEAAGVADFNNDGVLDIMCGDVWREGPDWTKTHEVLPIPEDGGYRLDFANTPMDVNGDGWMDVVSCNWHAMSVVWRENPGAKGGPWTQQVVDRPGNMETAIAADVDGDGNLDFLPDVGQNTTWYRLEDKKLVPYVVSPKIGGHGIGFGDVNGDGRNDIVKPGGWFEAPEDRLKGEWLWHGEWNLGATGISIVVHDFTGDGLADVFWANGHDYGTFWMEQTADADPAKKWIRREVDKDWSQGHALVLADLDGDGDQDVVTGKRKYAHTTDPGAEDPMIILVYSFDRASGRFVRETIHMGEGDGLGLAPVVTDLDGDGDLDLVCPGKSGLYVHLQEKSDGPSTPAESRAMMTLPEGFEATLVASEPDIRKPIAIAFDERGRMVVAEAAMYPLGPPPGEAPSDRILILEDADRDGHAETVKVFADGLNIPDAVAVGHGGIYVAEAPNLWFMKDTDGDDRADEKRAILTGFGTQDSHHNVHGLQWDPAGRLLMSQGCSTTSRILAKGVDGVEREWDLKEGDFFRCWPDGTGFEIVFKGFTNSWGYDWDEFGEWFCNDNEGPHLIHLVEGGDYGFSLTNRHDGKPGTLPGVEREYGDKRGYLVQSGLTVYDGTLFPERFRGRVMQGAPKLHRVIVDTIAEKGASYQAFLEEDLVASKDPWFLPIHLQVGPDGAVYVVDWYNSILAHVEHPLDSPRRDKTRGRIWRIAPKRSEWDFAADGEDRAGGAGADRPKYDPIPDLSKHTTAQLVDGLRSENKWVRRTSQRLLAAKGGEAVVAVAPLLSVEAREDESPRTRAHALWTLEEFWQKWHLEGHEEASDDVLRANDAMLRLPDPLEDPDADVRKVALRVGRHLGGGGGDEYAKRVLALTADPDDFVKFEAAMAIAALDQGSLSLDQVAPIIAGAAWNDPFLGFAFGKAIDPFKEPILERAFTIGARGLNDDGEALLPAVARLADPRAEPLLLAALNLPDLKPHNVDLVVDGLRAFPGPRVSGALVEYLSKHPDLPARLARPVLEDLRRRADSTTLAGDTRERVVAEALLTRLAEYRSDALLRDVLLVGGRMRATSLNPYALRSVDHAIPSVAEAALLALPDLQLPLAEGLRLHDGRPAIAPAREALEGAFVSSSGRRRWAALRGLARLGSTPAALEQPLLDALADPDTALDATRALRNGANRSANGADGDSALPAIPAALELVMERVRADRVALSRPVAAELRAWIAGEAADPTGLVRRREFNAELTAREGVLRDWLVVGPFPNPDQRGHATPYEPERDPGARVGPNTVVEFEGRRMPWTELRTGDPNGTVGLMHLEPNMHVVAYAQSTLESPTGGRATLFCGSDDSIKVWLNGKLVHDHLVDRGMSFDQDSVEVDLIAGTNVVLVKCGQNAGGWNFHARIETLPAAVRANPDDLATRAMHMPGDPARGELVFFGAAGCARCHVVGDRGGRVGPDLTEIGRWNPRSHLVRSILHPAEEIAEGFGGVTIVLKTAKGTGEAGDAADAEGEAGETLEGYIHRETPNEIELIDAEGRSRRIAKSDIADRRERAASGMPENFAEVLTARELTDVVEFLATR